MTWIFNPVQEARTKMPRNRYLDPNDPYANFRHFARLMGRCAAREALAVLSAQQTMTADSTPAWAISTATTT